MGNRSIILTDALSRLRPEPDRVFFVTDTGVAPLAGKWLAAVRAAGFPVHCITVPAGEASKSMDEAVAICTALTDAGATRRSVVVAMGGGMVTDLAGFAASIFRRGIRHINVATTLLGAVDAAIGGKTAVNLVPAPGAPMLKNEIGAFHLPMAVITASDLFPTLPPAQLREGYAEAVKTAMLSDSRLTGEMLEYDSMLTDFDRLAEVAERCAAFKKDVVERDPQESGLRRILNLGHTFGHAFESVCAGRPGAPGHGTAVAHGLLCALLLSNIKSGFPSAEVSAYTAFLKSLYSPIPLRCDDREAVIRLIARDKKSEGGEMPPFILLRAYGDPVVLAPTPAEASETWDLYRTLL